MRKNQSILAMLIFFVFVSCGIGFSDSGRMTAPRGCPELIDLIKKISPVVVSISIERSLVEKSSAESQPLFKTKQGPYDEKKFKDKQHTDSIGSGFFCDSQGHIVTNAHVVEGAGKILVTLPDGRVETAHITAVHPKVDLALLQIKNSKNSTLQAEIGNSTSVEVGEWVVAVGNPFGLGRTVTVGIVSGKGRFLGLGPDDNFIQTDAAINPGNSGGPLFNMAGEVIGVNTAIIASGKGIGFSIPSNFVRELLELESSGEYGLRGWLGIYVEDMTTDQARRYGLTQPSGTFVDEVMKSTPAQIAGLKKGDLIVDAAGKTVRNGKDLSKIVSASRPGETLQMKIIRGRSLQLVEVVIGRSPE